MDPFSLKSVKTLSRDSRTSEWVHAFLLGPGDNRALSDGLKKAERRWLGPIEVPVAWLERCCGPEPEMEFQVGPVGWSNRLATLTEALDAGVDFPPIIAEYRDGRLSVRDGNHRLGTFELAGRETMWTLIWYNSQGDLEEHRPTLLASGIL